MEKQLISKNIVIVGEFKALHFDKFYFIKNDIISENDFLPNSIFLPDFSNIETPNFNIQINESIIMINVKNIETDFSLLKLDRIINEIPVNAIGFNYKWFLFINSLDDTRKLFYFENNLLNKHFDTNNTAFGYYISRDFEGARMKLDIKPIQVQKIEEEFSRNTLEFDFNFHTDTKDIIKDGFLSKHKIFENQTKVILSEYE